MRKSERPRGERIMLSSPFRASLGADLTGSDGLARRLANKEDGFENRPLGCFWGIQGRNCGTARSRSNSISGDVRIETIRRGR